MSSYNGCVPHGLTIHDTCPEIGKSTKPIASEITLFIHALYNTCLYHACKCNLYKVTPEVCMVDQVNKIITLETD